MCVVSFRDIDIIFKYVFKTFYWIPEKLFANSSISKFDKVRRFQDGLYVFVSEVLYDQDIVDRRPPVIQIDDFLKTISAFALTRDKKNSLQCTQSVTRLMQWFKSGYKKFRYDIFATQRRASVPNMKHRDKIQDFQSIITSKPE